MDQPPSTPASASAPAPPTLHRRLGLVQATALNMIDMVGIGPFVTLPLVMGFMGPNFLLAWLVGAALSLVDGLIWSELGAAYPEAGGSYRFLKLAYGEQKWGRLMSFLYVWQTLVQAPLVVASGAIGFAQYFGYLVPLTEWWQPKLVSGGVVLLLLALLYRKIEDIGRLGVLLWLGVLGLMGWLILGGVTHATHPVAWLPAGGLGALPGVLLSAAMGQATAKTIYSYLGYYNVCHLGGEVREPHKIIPRSIFLSILGIMALYLLLNWSVGSVIPWAEASRSEFIVSTFVERIYGATAAKAATALVLWVAFASLFAVLLGYSRIPYAAAADGEFLPIFARTHPTKHFPTFPCCCWVG
ncbi:APC family permease [Hymenobacter sp. 5516J-16]|uniref:APC family permease n=1 Tax=Hymenobacter sp. 5516J-16 TaxID=2932253 RepID=UPI001FD588D9|nr:APC family permease [Hymenobacter sp. 5516J-16]UOQ78878.1 APC family permease [Hymenobacter sp. 5516J-16]